MLYSPGRAWLRATALLGCQGAASGRPELSAPRTKPLCGETDGAWEPPPWGAGLCVPPLHSVPWEKELSEVQGGNPEGCTARPGCSSWEASLSCLSQFSGAQANPEPTVASLRTQHSSFVQPSVCLSVCPSSFHPLPQAPPPHWASALWPHHLLCSEGVQNRPIYARVLIQHFPARVSCEWTAVALHSSTDP